MIKFTDFTYAINERTLFNNINLQVEPSSINALIIGSSSGKTSLFNLMQKIDQPGILYQPKKSRKKTTFINTNIPTDKVTVNYYMKDNITPKHHSIIKSSLIKYKLSFSSLNKTINKISLIDFLKIQLCITELNEHQIIVLDNTLVYLDDLSKNIMWRYLLMLKQQQKTTIIYLTHSINEVPYADYLTIFKNGDIKLAGPYRDILQNPDSIEKLGFELPFYVDLSNKLKLYSLVSNVCISKQELGDALWRK